MTPTDSLIAAALIALAAFCAGMATGLYRRGRIVAAAYAKGYDAGFSAKFPVVDVPKIQPRVAPFAGRGR